jgi:hypothetical protein
MSHSGRPNQALTCSRWITSELTVPSDSPAAARASTNPASTSVSNAASSSGAATGRASRRSRTTASANSGPPAFSYSARSTGKAIWLQES